ncbi:hypothetical protein FO440_23075 [Mucilaginibacter corticis]|uniref:Uncharacterized protein n=1 Tax=Mucilaginibacter corticis TaxID=2597670 RepID=A0A556M967_9SPHI|nr:hypothetical protein [Mucilaginibacter corticis]TSJ36386.1 hypothetical protein FO440_23075 [Mucilaginibacter corticis]
MDRAQKSAVIYLYLLPALVAAVGFGIGHVSYHVYLPLWFLNTCLMIFAIRQLFKRGANAGETPSGGWRNAGLLLIFPWILFAVFAGMGPPPPAMSAWLATAAEQEVRYSLLILGGILALMGFSLMKIKLADQAECNYAVLGLMAFSIALPLFILNMAYWGYFLTSAFRLFITLPAGKRPDWYLPVRQFFYVVSVVEVALTNLATLLFVLSLKKAKLMSPRSSSWFLAVGIMCIVLVILPPSVPEPFATAGYLAAVPAIPFMMPYLIGLRLLRLRYRHHH